MDVILPDLTGYEAPRRLKANRSTRHIPIIAVTANAAPAEAASAERDQALDADCNGYIAEPVDTRALPSKVRLFLN